MLGLRNGILISIKIYELNTLRLTGRTGTGLISINLLTVPQHNSLLPGQLVD